MNPPALSSVPPDAASSLISPEKFLASQSGCEFFRRDGCSAPPGRSVLTCRGLCWWGTVCQNHGYLLLHPAGIALCPGDRSLVRGEAAFHRDERVLIDEEQGGCGRMNCRF